MAALSRAADRRGLGLAWSRRLVLFVPLSAAAESRGHLLEAGHRLGLPGGELFVLVVGDGVAVDDVTGPLVWPY